MPNHPPKEAYLAETAQLLSHNLEIDLLANNQAWEQLRSTLIDFLDNLMRTDTNRLYYYLYRIDVSEKRIKKAVSETNDQILSAALLADLILERTLEKVKTRLAYRQWQQTQAPPAEPIEEADDW